MADPSGEKFAPAGGRLSGYAGLAIVAGIVVIDLVDLGSIPLPLLSGCLVLAVLMWATMIRPRVSTRAGTLVMTNAFDTVGVPLASIEDLSVRQVLAVRTARRRYVCSGVGRTVRQAIKSRPTGSSAEPARPTLGPAFGGDAPSQVEPGMAYADWVELRLQDLVQADREQRGIRAYSEQAEGLADDATRDPAGLELTALVLTVLVFLGSLLVHFL